MDLYIQFGYGMMKMSEYLIQQWTGGTVILSPRDMSHEQMTKFSSAIGKHNGKVVIDPQFYIPKANHDRLIAHSFWANDYQTAFFNKAEINRMLSVLKNNYNDLLQSPFFILPSLLISEVSEDWFNINDLIINEAIKSNVHENIFGTLCLSDDVMRSEENIHQILEYTETWNLDGYYIVPQPPKKNYLVDNPNWLINLLDLTAGLKQQGKKVIVGYSNHQMLCLALAKIDAIASGKWLNVRSFNPEKFNNPEGDGGGRRSTWYYSPQALSEYQIPFLDIANRAGMLQDLKTPENFKSDHADVLFAGAQPSVTSYSEKNSFNHYLQCLKIQAESAVKSSYSKTREGLRIQLETARLLTENLNNNGVRGRDRDFSNVVDVNISAIDVFDRLRGMIQEHLWDELH